MVHVMSKKTFDSLTPEQQKIIREESKKAGSNKKLLHLEQVLQAVAKVGSRDKLVDEIAKAQGRDKDDAYKARLGEESTPALWDRYQAVQSRVAGTPAK